MEAGDRASGLRPEVAERPKEESSGGGSFGPVLILLGLLAVIGSRSIPEGNLGHNEDPGPRAFPLWLGLCLVTGGVHELVSWFRRRRAVSEQPGPNWTSAWREGLFAQRNRNPWILVGALCLYLPAISWLGFSLATVLFAFGVMKRLGAGWWQSGFVSAGLVVVIHLLFVTFFKVQLPMGELGLPV